MNSLSMGKYRPAVILTLALTVFLASCKGTSDDPKWVVSTLAGGGTSEEFNGPVGVAVDSSGNVYVADTWNHRIRKIVVANDGTATVTTLAGTGSSGFANTGTDTEDNPVEAQFSFPSGMAVDSSGNLYVADTFNNHIRKITSGGDVTSLAGSRIPGFANGAGLTAAQFNSPEGVAVDSSGNIYVADTNNHRIRKIAFTTANNVVTATVSTIAGGAWGYKDGTAAQFDSPAGVAVDSSGNLYVADTNNHRIRKIAFTTANNVVTATVSTIAGTGTAGTADGAGLTAAQFDSPAGVAVDSSGNLYVAGPLSHTIRKVVISTGAVSTLAGGGTSEEFNGPYGVAVDSSGNIYVADQVNNRIRKIEYK